MSIITSLSLFYNNFHNKKATTTHSRLIINSLLIKTACFIMPLPQVFQKQI